MKLVGIEVKGLVSCYLYMHLSRYSEEARINTTREQRIFISLVLGLSFGGNFKDVLFDATGRDWGMFVGGWRGGWWEVGGFFVERGDRGKGDEVVLRGFLLRVLGRGKRGTLMLVVSSR